MDTLPMPIELTEFIDAATADTLILGDEHEPATESPEIRIEVAAAVSPVRVEASGAATSSLGDRCKASGASTSPSEDQQASGATTSPAEDHKASGAATSPAEDQKASSATTSPAEDHKASGATTSPAEDHEASGASTSPAEDHEASGATTSPAEDHPKGSTVSGHKAPASKSRVSDGPVDEKKQPAVLADAANRLQFSMYTFMHLF